MLNVLPAADTIHNQYPSTLRLIPSVVYPSFQPASDNIDKSYHERGCIVALGRPLCSVVLKSDLELDFSPPLCPVLLKLDQNPTTANTDQCQQC